MVYILFNCGVWATTCVDAWVVLLHDLTTIHLRLKVRSDKTIIELSLHTEHQQQLCEMLSGVERMKIVEQRK